MKASVVLSLSLLSLIGLILTGCNENGSNEPLTFSYSFDTDDQGWQGGFSDLPVNHAVQGYDVNFQYADIPVEDDEGGALLLKGNNHSDDLFLYTMKSFNEDDGFKSSTEYSVNLSFALATNVPPGLMGIGGSPGEGVSVKAGGVNFKPETIEENVGSEPYLRMNIDKGNQFNSGEDMIILGDAAKGPGPGQDDYSYQYKYFNHDFKITTNAEGELWVILGADSGFEGISELYFDNISITFTKILAIK
ncbi:hypothetical protein ACFLYQ_06770 [Chloroflexota bacterium]